jgi:single-strand DNA-binding protein
MKRAQGDQNMYLNQTQLIGYLGKDAEPRQTRSGIAYTILSVATNSRWKNKDTGDYETRTEWHRCVAWGKLSVWTGTLLKGAHLHIAGQLRSREYDKKLKSDRKEVTVRVRVWDVRVDQVLHLNRARHADGEGVGVAAPSSGARVDDDVPF